jgi:hypothetical protein
MIHVHRRDAGYQDRLRAYQVMLDGEEVGRVKRGESVTVDAAPGAHRLQLKIDWCLSKPIELQVAPGQDAYFECWPNSKPFTVLYWITFGRKEYIGLGPAAALPPGPGEGVLSPESGP